jgi:NADPH-dependent 2,4-dienoyl-CoA reductase/sulfur reductase-like enzyme
MSTIATKISASKLRVGTAAAVAVLATATLTPAIAEAAPSVSFAPVSQALGSAAVDVYDYSASFAGDNAAAAVTTFQPFAIIDGVVKFFATIVYDSLTFIGNTIIAVANGIARFFQVGPYAV